MSREVLRAVVVDDEPLARRGMCQLLARHGDVQIVAECSNGAAALAAVAAHHPDLIFLDVQMPEVDGFEVVRRIGAAHMPAIVFVTAYNEFAVRAFETAAVDYLVKPVGPERFAAAMRRVRERRSTGEAARRIDELQRLLAQVAPQEPPLSITTPRGLVLIEPAEIDWIGASDYYAAVHVGRRSYLLRESMASLAARLSPHRFLRVHRSVIVNRHRVRELRRSALVLHDGTRLGVSRRRRAAVVAALRAGPRAGPRAAAHPAGPGMAGEP